ncbi:amidase [Metarhizium acridum CQMa 102]|uniref:Amidase n=1 Tax=Metarhizium acridum (strain CQMa 102) TaxID=655827 RepID=E9EH02_METAQ|nr:amidase [Metarhizium acridum CQMa 102]EFY84787.1 amidase [Metarhizium acridum CQMa 102]
MNPVTSEARNSWSADDTILALRNHKLTVREHISDVLGRAERAQSLNAFINLLPDQALAAADKIDAAIAKREPLPPLAGLAIVVKDNINLAGFPNTGGTNALLTACPSNTAPSLEKLMVAGAVVIGKTNMHELAFGVTSTNLSPFAGPVRNPYAINMIPGGSSGGTAAAIASRVVTCGLGTDTGGSSRIPAALTGIAGYRPSVGDGGEQRRYHDDHGVLPISHTRDTVGPMGRSMAEVTLLDFIISGRPRAKPAQLHGVRLGIPPVLWTGLDKELEKTVLRAQHMLQEAGIELVKNDIPNLLELDSAVGLPIAVHEALTDIPAYLQGSRIKGVRLEDIFDGISSPDVKLVFGSIIDDTFGHEYNQVMAVRRPALQKLYADYFRQHRIDAILFPTTILPATPIDIVHGSGNVSINCGPPMDAFTAYTRNTAPGSDAGIPGLSIPVGKTADGLPVGIEIDGPLGSDERLLSLGLAMEKVLGCLPGPKPWV